MDRNLGALDTKYHSDGGKAKYYQFGRKDPFNSNIYCWTYNSETFMPSQTVTGAIVRISKNILDDMSGIYKTDGKNMPFSVGHPDNFITSSREWTVGDVFNPTPYNANIVWQDPQISNKLENEETDKSIFDPCPLGWSVPVNGWARGLIGDSSGDATGNPRVTFQWVPNILSGSATDAKGRTYYPNGYLADKDNAAAPKIYFPASGLFENSGLLCYLGVFGVCWSCNSVSNDSGRNLVFYETGMESSNYYIRTRAFSVRCVQKYEPLHL